MDCSAFVFVAADAIIVAHAKATAGLLVAERRSEIASANEERDLASQLKHRKWEGGANGEMGRSTARPRPPIHRGKESTLRALVVTGSTQRAGVAETAHGTPPGPAPSDSPL